MADITMCKNDKCPVKNNCLRFTAIPTMEWQAYDTFFYDYKKKKCDFFIERSAPVTDAEELN